MTFEMEKKESQQLPEMAQMILGKLELASATEDVQMMTQEVLLLCLEELARSNKGKQLDNELVQHYNEGDMLCLAFSQEQMKKPLCKIMQIAGYWANDLEDVVKSCLSPEIQERLPVGFSGDRSVYDMVYNLLKEEYGYSF